MRSYRHYAVFAAYRYRSTVDVTADRLDARRRTCAEKPQQAGPAERFSVWQTHRQRRVSRRRGLFPELPEFARRAAVGFLERIVESPDAAETGRQRDPGNDYW